MNKAVHALVYVILVGAAAALYFEVQLYGKKELLKDRNRQLEDYLVRISNTIEKQDAAKSTNVPEARKDVSPTEAKLVETPETENVLDEYPAQLEEVINRHPKVSDCMVTAVPDASRGQAVVAYIVPADESLTVKEINHYCVHHDDISTYKCPRYYAFVKELPYNATGKKLHYKLKAQAEEDLAQKKLLRP